MDNPRRVVIHDKPPFWEPEVISRPVNQVALGVAGISLLFQCMALVQVIMGLGKHVGWFDHVGFATISFLWLALGVLVFLQRQARRAARLFLLSSAAGAMFLSLTTLYTVGLINALPYAIGLLFFPPLLYSFAQAYSERKVWKKGELLLYLPPLLLIWPAASALSHDHTGLSVRLGLVLVAGYLLAAIIQAARELFAPRSPEHTAQTRALLVGLVAGTVPGIAIFIVPLVMTTNLAVATSWLPTLILLFLVGMSYAVLLFEFTEADLIVRRGFVYGILTLAIVVAYGVLDVVLSASGAALTSPGGGLSFVAVTVLIGAAFSPITRTARRLVDWLLYGRRTDRWQLLEELSARLARVMQPDELGRVLVRELTNDLHLRGAFLLRRSDDGTFALRHRAQDRSAARYNRVPDDLVLPSEVIRAALGETPSPLLMVHARPLTARRAETVPASYKHLDDLGAALTIPLVTRSGLEAVLCLQSKLAHDAFDADDLELLAPVIRQATAALDNALLFARLAEKVEELRHAYMRIAREQEAERARLARELHDGTAQELAGLITLATVVERQLRANEGAALVTLERLRQQAEDAYQGVRRASHALRPLMLDDFGLAPTLGRYLEQFQNATGISVEYTASGVHDLPDDVELALFRIAQECMENVRKHSGALSARLLLERQNGHVTLSVVDAGNGLPPDGERGIGLAGMRERIEAVGGAIRVGTRAEGGVLVEAEVPVGEEA